MENVHIPESIKRIVIGRTRKPKARKSSEMEQDVRKTVVEDAAVYPLALDNKKIDRPAPIQHTFFDKQDQFIAAKEGGLIDKSLDNANLHLQEIKNVMEEVDKGIDTLVNVSSQTLQAVNKPQQQGNPLGPITAGNIREPATDKAYELRGKVWNIIHGIA